MKCKLFTATVAFGISTMLMADFTEDFQGALKLYNGNKSEEAFEKFTELARIAPKPASKSDALYYAAMSSIKLQQFQKAEELIADIPRESTKKLCRMNLMLAQKQPQHVIDAFKDEDIDKWPDYHSCDVLTIRGEAYMKLQKFEEAIKDFKKAEEFTMDPVKRGVILCKLGMALKLSGNDDEAMSVYRRIADTSSLKGRGIGNDAHVSIARILMKQQKYDEAEKELSKIEPAEFGYWHSFPLMAQAEIYIAQGRKSEALAKYKEALTGAPDELEKTIQKAIDNLK